VADFAVTSETAHRAFVYQLFHHLVKQDPAAYGPQIVEEIRLEFAAAEFSMRKLALSIAARTARHGFSDPVPSNLAPMK
jgi:hypothetical protein